jgi:hypothetical protein
MVDEGRLGRRRRRDRAGRSSWHGRHGERGREGWAAVVLVRLPVAGVPRRFEWSRARALEEERGRRWQMHTLDLYARHVRRSAPGYLRRTPCRVTAWI